MLSGWVSFNCFFANLESPPLVQLKRYTMDFNVQADLIPLFQGLVTGLKPYAQAQDVVLDFHSDSKELYAYYNPQKVLSEITVFT